MLTTKKAKDPTTYKATAEYQVLDVDGNEVARIYRRESTKTGFKNGRCIGQVRAFGWFYRMKGGAEEGRGTMGPKWRTMRAALDALTTAYTATV